MKPSGAAHSHSRRRPRLRYSRPPAAAQLPDHHQRQHQQPDADHDAEREERKDRTGGRLVGGQLLQALVPCRVRRAVRMRLPRYGIAIVVAIGLRLLVGDREQVQRRRRLGVPKRPPSPRAWPAGIAAYSAHARRRGRSAAAPARAAARAWSRASAALPRRSGRAADSQAATPSTTKPVVM